MKETVQDFRDKIQQAQVKRHFKKLFGKNKSTAAALMSLICVI
jgi:hypothetical protein